jgi:thiaminase/transcriptional activator TenA
MSERYSRALRARLAPVWEAQHKHPFVIALGDGSLPAERFLVWLRQDHLRLVEYARVLFLAAGRATGIDTMRSLSAMARGVLYSELLMHQAYAVEFGVSESDLADGKMLPTTQAYTDHLLRTASLGTPLDLAAAILPGLWCYHEIACKLAPNANPAYERWIRFYSGPDIGNQVDRACAILDGLARGASAECLGHAEEAFALSSRYEWMFWEMGWRGEKWPV